MISGELGGYIGGIIGGLGGLVGGMIGTYCSVKNTSGPRERTFMIKSALVCWAAILIFLALLFVLPNPYRWFMWIPYGILLPIGVTYCNKKQKKIRQEEAEQEHGADSDSAH